MKIFAFVLVLLSTVSYAITGVDVAPVKSVLPLTKARMVYVVTVDINGTPRNLIVDTGAEVTMLSANAAGMSMTTFRKTSATAGAVGVGGEADKVQDATVNLTVGQLNLKQHDVLVVRDMANHTKSLGMQIDGLLGQDVLARFASVSIDYKAMTLTLVSR